MSESKLERYIIDFNGAQYDIIDKVSETVVASYSTRNQANDAVEKLNEEKGW